MKLSSLPFLLLCTGSLDPAAAQGNFDLVKQSRDAGSGTLQQQSASWVPARTAFIICDMWDAHHSANAARRTGELAPSIDAFARAVRARGGLVIHAPSSTVGAYADHPARQRAVGLQNAPDLPDDIGSWCHWKDGTEEAKGYPIDHSDGGEDDEPAALEVWHKKLAAQGRNPRSPWQRQIDTIFIDPDRDAISDNGVEIWNLLHHRKIEHVFVAGVHLNMCVLGRPFGLRQLSRNGVDVVLVRDLTDTMYDPRDHPQVSHFQGTDLVVAHVERWVCPTVSSDQVLTGRAPFRFPADTRPHLLAMIGEREYRTVETLPAFLEKNLGDQFRLHYALPSPDDRNSFPAVTTVRDADLLVLSVRRRTLPETQLALLEKHVAAGKPVVGIRTSSHAFALRKGEPPAGHATWPEFDQKTLGGNYQGHHGNDHPTTVSITPAAGSTGHPVLQGIAPGTSFRSGGSLYINTPLAAGTTLIATGAADGIERPEPVAWTNSTPHGGRVFYTSLGHVDDFATDAFVRLLSNACRWAAEKQRAE